MKIRPYDAIAGDSLGGLTDRDMALQILDFIREHDSEPSLPHALHIFTQDQMVKAYRDLAEDRDDDIDLDHYTYLLDMCPTLPAYTSFQWIDNELRIMPNIEHAAEDCQNDGSYSEGLPIDDDGEDINPYNCNYWMTCNDHGNVSFYEWKYPDKGTRPQWCEIWSAV